MTPFPKFYCNNVISLAAWRPILRPTREHLDSAADLWILAAQQAYLCMEVCRAALECLEACQMKPDKWLKESYDWWAAEYRSRCHACEEVLEQRER